MTSDEKILQIIPAQGIWKRVVFWNGSVDYIPIVAQALVETKFSGDPQNIYREIVSYALYPDGGYDGVNCDALWVEPDIHLPRPDKCVPKSTLGHVVFKDIAFEKTTDDLNLFRLRESYLERWDESRASHLERQREARTICLAVSKGEPIDDKSRALQRLVKRGYVVRKKWDAPDEDPDWHLTNFGDALIKAPDLPPNSE